MGSNDSNLPEILSEASEGQRFYERVKRRVLYRRPLSREQRKELSDAVWAGWLYSILTAKEYSSEESRLVHFEEWALSLKPIELPLVADPEGE